VGNLYEWFMKWTAERTRTDIWRAVIGIIIVAVLLAFLTGCATSGPSMTLASSAKGDGFIQISQPVYQSAVTCTPPKHEVFIDYLHHSEIFQETNEDVYDGIRLGYTHRFGKWKWQK